MQAPTFPELRKQYTPDTNYCIKQSELTVTLTDDPKRARYAYQHSIAVTGSRAETEWEIVIPSLPPNVQFDGARDADGGLQHTFIPDGNSTRIPIRYRHEVSNSSPPYQFSYGYETSVKAVVTPSMRGQVIHYTDWFMPDVQCDVLKISIRLPKRCRAIQAFPATNLDTSVVSFTYERMRPLEVFPIVLVYHKPKIGREAWLWMAGVLASGLVGALIGSLIQ
jgi:hypothetical protein